MRICENQCNQWIKKPWTEKISEKLAQLAKISGKQSLEIKNL